MNLHKALVVITIGPGDNVTFLGGILLINFTSCNLSQDLSVCVFDLNLSFNFPPHPYLF